MEELIGKKVVIDTDSSFIYLGKLLEIARDSYILEDVDVHDKNDIEITKEKYVHDSTRTGVKKNRNKVYVIKERVVSLSALDDVISF